MNEVIQKLTDMEPFIEYLKNTKDEDWQTDKVRSGNKNCVMGHLVDWYYGKGFQGVISPVWDIFEEMWATTYMVYPVNDGQNPKYKQETPKERIVAYLEDLKNGKEKRTCQLI